MHVVIFHDQQEDVIIISDDTEDNKVITGTNHWKLHAADLIPKPKDGAKKRRSYVRCFNCHERGHRTFECTSKKVKRH